MWIDCGQLDPGAMIRLVPSEWDRVCPSASTKRSLRTGALAAMRYQLAASTIGAHLAVADA